MLQLPDIPVRYTRFPDNYINDVNGWGFDRDTIDANSGRLLTLDIDYGTKCSLNCPFCFRRDNSVDAAGRALTFDDLLRVVLEAKELGLMSIKLLGAGEPLENSRILEFLRLMRSLDITPVVFTKTAIIGDDERTRSHFSQYGIASAEQLAAELYNCGASIVLGWNSFDTAIQCRMTGAAPEYMAKRTRALRVLIDAGFADSNPTRLALGINPVTTWNIQEVLSIYTWARERNMYAVVTPTMVSGRMKGENWRTITPSARELIQLYADIYSYNINTNLISLDCLSQEGISAYAGGRPCNQVAVGLYVTLNGVVLSCPGREDPVLGNVWESRLGDIWRGSENYQRRGILNCRCVAKDGLSIPRDLYHQVGRRLGIKDTQYVCG